MITYGYAKGYQYSNDGTLMIKVRIPSVHGAYELGAYRGKLPRNYVRDEDLPWYPSLLLPQMPSEGDVVAITSLSKGNNNFLILGLTGGSYNSGATNIEG